MEDAKILDKVTYNEICQLANEGAKVIHPRAVEIAMQKNIPIRIKCTFSDSPGTLVTNHGEVYGGTIDITLDRTITGITHVPDLTQVTIDLDSVKLDNINLKVFKGLALAGISLDFWNVNTRYISFTVKDNQSEKTKQILENIGIIPVYKVDALRWPQWGQV